MVDLGRMKRRWVPRAPPAPSQEVSADLHTWNLIVWALAGEACRVCGGASWVAEHEPGCPIEALAKELGVIVEKGPCRHCGKAYEAQFTMSPIVHGECGGCYMDRSRGKVHCEGRARAAVKRAKSAKQRGDMKSARKHAAEAKRCLSMAKVART